MDYQLASSEQIEVAMGRRLEALRLSQNITQAQLAEAAGVSRSTVSRLGRPGKGISLDSFVRLVQALGLADLLAALLPDPVDSPLERLARGAQPRRQRARPKAAAETSTWHWELAAGEDSAGTSETGDADPDGRTASSD